MSDLVKHRTELPTDSERAAALNEAIKEFGNELWERGEEWHEVANTVYKGAKQVWIAYNILRNAEAKK